MASILLIVPFAIVLGLLLYSVVRSLVQVWLNYRVKLALLDKLERKPELVHSLQDLPGLLDNVSHTEGEKRQDWRFTGGVLTLIGAGSVLLAQSVGSGRWAVGAYLGGLICILLGFLLVIVGLFIHLLRKSPRPDSSRVKSLNPSD